MIFGFGRKKKKETEGSGPGEVAEVEQYRGFELLARPVSEGGVWRVAGTVRRPGDDEGPQHDFVRANTMLNRDEAVQMSLLKARQLVDEQGARLLETR